MPEEAVVESPSSEPSLSDYRAEREGKVTPAADPVPAEPAKSADGPEPSKQESSEVEEAGTDTKPKGGFQRRIDKLTKEIGERDRQISDLNSRLAALEEKKPEVKAEAKADGDPKPKADQFKEYDEYLEAVSRWVARQELKAEKESQAKSEQERQKKDTETAAKAQFDKFLGQMQKVREANPDYDDVFSDTQIPNYIHNRLVRMENGAEVAYQLAKNKEVLGKILELNQKALDAGDNDFSDAYWEFGAFVRSLKDSPKPVERPVSKAPSPITPVRGGDAPTDADEDSMSLSEYRKRREARR